MSNEFSPSSVAGLWQSQPTEPHQIAPEQFHRKMQKFERKIAWRNIREYVAGAFVVVAFGYYAFMFSTLLVRIGCGFLIAGVLYVMCELHRRASAQPASAELAPSSCVEFQRRQLVRQRDALRSVWSWYLLPFIPGMFLFLCGLFEFAMRIAQAAGKPFHVGAAIASFSLISACVAAVFFAVWKLNQWAANKLQVQIDELDALMRSPG
jgi:hypothetical protein